MDYLISRNAAIQAMLKEQQDDIKEYGCSIPECFDGIVRCKDCINRPFKIHQDRESNGFNLDARMVDNFSYYCPFMCEDGWYSTMPEDDFYCKNGERRHD